MTDAGYKAAQEYVRGTVRRWGRGRTILVAVLGALVMVAVGVIFSAYAAGQGADPVEGESFTHPPGTEVVLGNQYSGGKALKITSGQALPTKRVTITETSNVLVRARAGQTGGSPTLTIRVDGSNKGTRRITSASLSDYLYSGVILEPGTYTIGLKGGDLAQGRYVYVDVLRFPAVTPPSVPPVAVDDTKTVAEDDPATTLDVLANDTDVDGDPLTIASVSNPAHGTAVVESGKVNYTPAANYNGSDSFSYTVSDGNGGTDTATVSITVESVNDTPVAEVDEATTDEDNAVTIDVLANDTDVDGDTLTIVAGSLSNPAHGTAVVESGKVNYTPAGNYNGPDEFTYEVSDGNGGTDTATVSITVNSVDDAPVAEDDSATTPEDTAVTIDVLANDTDADGGTMTIESVTQPTNGTVEITNNGSDLTYEPDENYCNGGSPTDDFTYKLNGGSTATVAVTVTCVEDDPVAVDDTKTVAEDDPATTIDVLNNDTDVDGGSKTIDSVTQPTNGTVITTNGGSDLTYKPNADYCNENGEPDTFTYTLNGGSTANVDVTVTCVDDTPVAVDDTNTVAEDDPATTIDVLNNDTDPDGGTKTIESVTQPTNGTVEITNNGNDLTYTPDADYCNDGSPTDDFTYKLNGGSEANVSVTVTCVDDAPVAVDDTNTVAEDDPATTIDVLNNDTDPDGGTKTIESVTQPTNGTVEITNDGADLTYKPNADYCNENGEPDTFTYTLNGGSTANVDVTVTCVEDDPVAVDDTKTVAEDDPATTIDVLNNDTDVDGGSKTIDSVTQPTNGTVIITNGGSDLTYEPDADYCNDSPGTGPDTFTYTLSPGGSTATVSVKVTCVDDPPVAVNDSATVEEDAAATSVSVLTNDTDIDGGPKTISSASDPANGTVVVTGGGSGLTYQPDPNYCNDPPATNLDTFTYTLNGSSQGRVSMTVTCVNDNPVATDESFNGTSRAIGNTSLVVNDPTDSAPDPNGPQKTVSGDILSNDTDVDGPGPLAVQAVSNKVTTDGGSVNIEADGDFTFHPKAGTSCTDHTDSFDYTLTDGNTPTAGTDTGTVTIDIQDCVWYVDSSLGTNGDGRSHSPFNSLSGINGAGGTGDPDDANQKIFLYDGTYSGGLPLENGQTLFSQRHGLVVPDGGSGNVTLEAAVPAGANTTITGGLTLGQNNTIQGIHLGNATGAALSGSSVGNATMNTVTSGAIDNQTGKAVDISGGTLSMQFTGVSSTNSSTDGIRLDNTAGTFNASGGSIQNANGEDVDISGNNSGDTVDFTYDGSITDDLGTLVNVSGQNGGTKDFNGAITDGNDGDGSGIALTNNIGATVRFDGGLTLSTGGTNTPFLAAAGGTVVVTDPAGATDNTLASTTGTALNVTNATIGSNGLTFKSISSNGASNGISLTNTGNSGGLTVTGNGGTCSSAATCTGGAIQNTTGQGILLTNVGGSVSLTRMFVNDSADDGIRGSNVNGLTLDNATVTSNGNANGENGIDFTQLTGTSPLTNSNVSSNFDSNVFVSNASGVLNLNVTGGAYSGASGGQGDGIFVEGTGTGSQNLNVQGPITFANNVGDHIQHSADADNTTDSDVTINNTTMTSPPAAGGGPFCANNILGGGIVISHGGNAVGGSNLDATVTNNNIQNSCIGAIAVGTSGSVGDQQIANVDATIQNNTIGTAGVAGSGSVQGNGIFVDSNGNSVVRTLITGNTIRQWTNRNGIALDILDGDAEMSATVRGNLLTEPNSAFAGTSTRGMTIQLGSAQTGDSIDACLDIGHATDNAQKNTLTDTGESPQPDVRYLHEGSGSVVQLAGFSGTANQPNISNWFTSRNIFGPTPVISGLFNPPSGASTTGVVSCPQPTP